MAYKVYTGNSVVQTISATSTSVLELDPATIYLFSVSESDGTDESSKSNVVRVETLGRIIVPTTKEIMSIKFSTNGLGIEADGFGMSTTFGGTVPVDVPAITNTITNGTRVLEVETIYHMNNQVAVLTDTNKYLIIDGNKSIEIIVR